MPDRARKAAARAEETATTTTDPSNPRTKRTRGRTMQMQLCRESCLTNSMILQMHKRWAASRRTHLKGSASRRTKMISDTTLHPKSSWAISTILGNKTCICNCIQIRITGPKKNCNSTCNVNYQLARLKNKTSNCNVMDDSYTGSLRSTQIRIILGTI